MSPARTLAVVAGAEAALVEAAAAARDGTALDAAGAVLAESAAGLDLSAAAAASRAEARGVVVAALAEGPVLAARWFQPGEQTAIHGHGAWGVAVVCSGETRHERWSRTGSAARLDAVREVAPRRWTTWAAPPDDVHRQTAGPEGSLELVLLGREPHSGRELVPASGTLERGVAALASYDFRALAGLYRDDVLFDANVPQWRYQLQGPEAILAMSREELGGLEDLRVTTLRASYGADVVAVQVAVRFGEAQHEHRWREVHLLREQGGAIAEHTVYCTGIWDPGAIARQAADAPIVRP